MNEELRKLVAGYDIFVEAITTAYGTLHQGLVERNKFVAETDPKTYGSNEAQREAFLAMAYPAIEEAKSKIKIYNLNITLLEFQLRCFELSNCSHPLNNRKKLGELVSRE